MFKINQQKCNQCLFSNNRVVSEERKNEIVNNCLEGQTHFICHKFLGRDICCKGFYDLHKDTIDKFRVFQRMNLLKYVNLNNE